MYIIITLKTVLILMFLIIGFQDVKERKVHWFLFPLVGVLCGLLFYNNTLPELFVNAIIMNLIFIFLLILTMLLYSRLKLKTKFFNVIGLGDILLFIGVTLSFSTISFIIIFICALLFSLLMHLALKRLSSFKTIPLAGYMSMFFSITYFSYWSGLIKGLYSI